VLHAEVWPEEAEELERRLRSAVAVAEFARDSGDLHPDQRKRLVNEAIWFWTERGSITRKYRLRYRTPAAITLQNELGFTAAAKQLAHEHVHERSQVAQRLLAHDSDAHALMISAAACVVTRAEHKLLTSAIGVAGWKRYVTVGLHPTDMVTGGPMDLQAAADADSAMWGEGT
jgi:hypothetical protein